MHVDLAIVKQEVDIDDTKIKLELDKELSDNSTMQISWAVETFKMIGGQDSQVLSMPDRDSSLDKSMSVVRKCSSSSQQQASRTNNPNPFQCRICHFLFDKHLDISAHMVDHQINRHFCNFGCGEWLDSLEKILEHEYRHHSRPGLLLCCRICDFVAKDADNLATHMQNHVYVYRFVCAICRQHFESIEGIERHRTNSTYLCGQVKYIDGPSTKAELVAIDTTPVSVSGQVLCDVQIKSEPLEVEEEMAPMQVGIVKAEPQEPEKIQEVSVKEDPDSVEQTINSCGGFWSSIPNPLRSKLRLPAVKASNAQMKLKRVVNEIHSSDGNQSIISQLASDKTRILQKKPPKTAANILKVLPSNCMVIKLPPNTKIIKMVGQAPASALNKSNVYVHNVSEKSTSSAFVIPQSITISQIKPEEANQIQPVLPVSSASSLLPQTHNRNSSLLHDAFNKAESHPESMKIISEFRDQIRSIEKTLPLPGTVLQSAKTKRNYPSTFSTSVNAPKPIELFLGPLSLTVVNELRITYPLYGFLWTCPLCHRSYEQNYAIRMHMISNHNLSQEQLNYLKVMLMPYKLLSQDNRHLESEQQEQKSCLKGKVANVASLLLDTTPPTPTTPLIIDVKNNVSPTKAKPDKSLQNEERNKKNKIKCSEFQCTECLKTFTTFGALRIHKTIHTGELPYKCDYCEKRFRTPGQVRVHHRRHTGEKPFKCKVCSLDFTHRETLISHLSRHIGMKRYKCYGCDKYFVVVSGLRAHRRLRPDTCGKVKFTARAHGPRVRVVRGKWYSSRTQNTMVTSAVRIR